MLLCLFIALSFDLSGLVPRKRWLKPPAGLCEHLLVIGKPEKNEAAAILLSQQEDVGPHGFEPPLKYYQRPADGAHIQVGPCAWSVGEVEVTKYLHGWDGFARNPLETPTPRRNV